MLQAPEVNNNKTIPLLLPQDVLRLIASQLRGNDLLYFSEACRSTDTAVKNYILLRARQDYSNRIFESFQALVRAFKLGNPSLYMLFMELFPEMDKSHFTKSAINAHKIFKKEKKKSSHAATTLESKFEKCLEDFPLGYRQIAHGHLIFQRKLHFEWARYYRARLHSDGFQDDKALKDEDVCKMLSQLIVLELPNPPTMIEVADAGSNTTTVRELNGKAMQLNHNLQKLRDVARFTLNKTCCWQVFYSIIYSRGASNPNRKILWAYDPYEERLCQDYLHHIRSPLSVPDQFMAEQHPYITPPRADNLTPAELFEAQFLFNCLMKVSQYRNAEKGIYHDFEIIIAHINTQIDSTLDSKQSSRKDRFSALLYKIKLTLFAAAIYKDSTYAIAYFPLLNQATNNQKYLSDNDKIILRNEIIESYLQFFWSVAIFEDESNSLFSFLYQLLGLYIDFTERSFGRQNILKFLELIAYKILYYNFNSDAQILFRYILDLSHAKDQGITGLAIFIFENLLEEKYYVASRRQLMEWVSCRVRGAPWPYGVSQNKKEEFDAFLKVDAVRHHLIRFCESSLLSEKCNKEAARYFLPIVPQSEKSLEGKRPRHTDEEPSNEIPKKNKIEFNSNPNTFFAHQSSSPELLNDIPVAVPVGIDPSIDFPMPELPFYDSDMDNLLYDDFWLSDSFPA
jgi:hypothetical protein